jgi:hypothetical protein
MDALSAGPDAAVQMIDLYRGQYTSRLGRSRGGLTSKILADVDTR